MPSDSITLISLPRKKRGNNGSDQATTANGVTGASANGDNVFRSLEKQAYDRHCTIPAAKKVADASDDSDLTRSNGYSDEGYDFDDIDTEIAAGKENLKAEEIKKPKPKKEKKN